MEIQRKLKWENFENSFGSWSNRIKPFFDSGGFEKIYAHLKSESARGKIIAPTSDLVFRAFRETNINDVKLIIVGLSPYHSLYNGKPIADGLCMSCSITKKLQPSLLKFYEEMERELNNSEPCIRDPDLSYLARDNGVLLLNAALTTTILKAGNHLDLWNPFMKYLFEEVLITNGIPVILLGKEAAKLKRYIMPFTWIFELSHPASAAYSNEQWNSNGVFISVNKIIKENNNNEIQWMKI